MLVFGASGHGKVVIECLEENKISINGIFDDDLSKINICGHDVIGPYDPGNHKEDKLIIAIGDNAIRKKISKKIVHNFGYVIHPTAIVSKRAYYGDGTVIFHNAVVQPETKIGAHVIINTSSSIDHECTIEDFVHISPNATLCGNVNVGQGTHVGASATVLPNIKIGSWVTVGAGTVIIKDIPDYAVVVGNPGKIIKYKDRSLYEF